jgi:ATP-binding cassette, subfamily B, bacterial
VVALLPALALSVGLPLIGPQLLRHFVDDAIGGRPVSGLVLIAVGYLVIALGAQIATVTMRYLASRLAWLTTNRIREDLAAHVLGLDLAFHAHRTAGELIERVDGDIIGLTDFLSEFVIEAIGSALLLVGALVLVWVVDIRLGLAFTALVIIGATVLSRTQRLAVPLAAAQREQTAQLFGSLEERLVGAEDIRANGAGAHVLRRFHEDSARVFKANVRWERVGGGMLAATNFYFAIGTAAILALGIVLLDQRAITIGTVVLLFQYAQMVRNPVEQIIGQAKQLQEAASGFSRVAELLDERPTVVEAPAARPLPETGALDVRLRDITFAYPGDPPVLQDVNLTVPAGRSLGLVGRTGSGKTTIARLLLRLYDPTHGVVELNGVELNQARLDDVRARVRMVTQDVQLFAADVRDNLTLFDTAETDDDALVSILDEVGLGPWFRTLPEGLNTVIGAGQIGMSAGEAQLLAFARVFLADPGLVVLDEASSRLDPDTELLVERATARLLTGRTAVLIAHRLSSLARVDDIAVLDHGRLVEHGPRIDLMADPTSRFAQLLEGAARR